VKRVNILLFGATDRIMMPVGEYVFSLKSIPKATGFGWKIWLAYPLLRPSRLISCVWQSQKNTILARKMPQNRP